MKLSCRKFACLASVMGLLGDVAPSQHGTDYLREHFRNAGLMRVGGAQYRLELRGSPQGASAALLDLGGVVVSSLALPWHYNGGLAIIDADSVLAGGLRLSGSRVGVMARLSVDSSGASPQLVLHSSLDYAGIDPVLMSVAKGMDRVFIVDSVGNRLLSAQSGVLPPPQASLALVADSVAVPSLADRAVGAYMRLGGAADSLSVQSWYGVDTGWGITTSGGSWIVQGLADQDVMWMTGPASLSLASPGQFWLPARYQGGLVNLMSPEGALLGSVNATPGAWNPVPTSVLFSASPGCKFQLLHPQTGASINLYPIHRSGVPISVPELTVERGRVWPNAILGNQEFGSGVGFNTAITAPFLCGASMAFRNQSGDPIDGQGFLTPEAFVVFAVDPSLMGETVGVALPLPANQAIDGEVILFQYLFLTPGGSLARSDVFGVTLKWDGSFAGPSAAMATSGGSLSSGAGISHRSIGKGLLRAAWESGRNSDRSEFARMKAAWHQ